MRGVGRGVLREEGSVEVVHECHSRHRGKVMQETELNAC